MYLYVSFGHCVKVWTVINVINLSDMSLFLQNLIHCSWHPFVCNISSSLFIFSAYRNYPDYFSHILPNTEESKSVFSALCCVRGSGKVRGHIAREIKLKKVPNDDRIVMCFLLQICSLNQCGFLWRPIQCVQHIDRFRGM